MKQCRLCIALYTISCKSLVQELDDEDNAKCVLRLQTKSVYQPLKEPIYWRI